MTKKEICVQPEIKKAIFDYLSWLDEIYTSKNLPIEKRPLLAACYIIDYGFQTPSNIGKDELFISLLNYTYPVCIEWYYNIYGEKSIDKKLEEKLYSFVEIKGVPYRLVFPKVITQNCEKNLTWMYFPERVLDEENVQNYIEDNDVIKKLNISEKNQLIQTIIKRISYIRTIYFNTMQSDNANEYNKELSEINSHIEIASKTFVETYNTGISTSIWEIFFSAELMIKQILRDNSISFSNIHDIKKLVEKIPNGKELAQNDFFSIFPNYHDAIKYRYSELVCHNFEKAIQYYDIAISFIFKSSKMLKRHFRFPNNRVLLRKILNK